MFLERRESSFKEKFTKQGGETLMCNRAFQKKVQKMHSQLGKIREKKENAGGVYEWRRYREEEKNLQKKFDSLMQRGIT